MDTLLTKVQRVEAEANKIISDAREKAGHTLHELQSREGKTIAETREAAENRAKEIIQEGLREAEREINSTVQQGKHAVDVVHTAAEKNRADALTLGRQLFSDEYLI